MKEHVVRALIWAVAIMLGLIMVNLVEKEQVEWLKAICSGVAMGLVDFIFSVVADKVKNKRKKS